jgi:exopolysaccharide biosynthesis polyprenyl glycosylphosphotransferase
MDVLNRRVLMACLKLSDLLLLMISYGLATVLAARSSNAASITEFLSIRIKLSNCIIFAAILLSWHIIFLLLGLYESKRLSTRQEELVSDWKATTAATVCLFIFATFATIRMVNLSFLIVFWGVSSILMVSSRQLLRLFLGKIRRDGHNSRYVLILGTNPRAIKFARTISERPELGYKNLGFVDEFWSGSEEFGRSGYSIACAREKLAEFLRQNVVDEVAMFLPLRSFYEDAARITALCQQHGIIVRYDADIFGLRAARGFDEEIDGRQVEATSAGTRDGLSVVFKRLFDICFSVALLVILSPLLCIAALLIKLSSNGPVLFTQERVGLNKRRFRIYKFRTMVPDAEKMMAQLETLNEVSGPVFKIKHDPRTIPIGNWLRKTSIDELPQLFNVLKGDMSLVGPRPLPLRDYQGFGEDWQRRRFCVRPGITCLWQVQGRSSIGFDQWMKLDMQYLDEWSLWLDLKILAQTIPAVFKGSGAV